MILKKEFSWLSLLILLGLTSCLSIARMSDFPQSSKQIDFDKYSITFKSTNDPIWNFETSNEYYFETGIDIKEDVLIKLIKESLETNGYWIKKIDSNEKFIAGERGLMANEWSTISFVYYNYSINYIRVYISSRITQDITGGWRENRAKQIGLDLKNLIDKNK
jgi:hypothetical protein